MGEATAPAPPSDGRRRRELLKHLILELHHGQAPEAMRAQITRLLGSVPYDEVVAVEQELIAEGLPPEEAIRLCDLHGAALQGAVDLGRARSAPPGHPVHTFQAENRALEREAQAVERGYAEIAALAADADATGILAAVRPHFHALADVEKHYRRKENLLFPFLGRHGITGPPAVMWGKHGEARALLKAAIETLAAGATATGEEARALIDLVLRPATAAIAGMIDKEEQILPPMCLDTLTDSEYGQAGADRPAPAAHLPRGRP